MLSIHYANCLSERVGEHGLEGASVAPGSPSALDCARMTASLESTRGRGWERWRLLPFDPMRAEHVGAIRPLVQRLRPACENLIVLGIGGSALGNIALQASLNSTVHNLLPAAERPGPRMFVVDNVDPANLGAVMSLVKKSDPTFQKTVFNVVSKSGETAETAAQFMLVRQTLIEALGREKHAQRIVAITDPAKGTMRKICDDAGYATLPVPDGVGGRFSVLSPVGLFSAAMCGVDIDGLLDGAAEMDARCREPEMAKNPAATLATLLVRLGREKGKTAHVMMPYSNQLYLLADWFRQLWAESLGKRVDQQGKEVFAGFTPIKALGTTDQHSQVQLYREGPNDKAFVLVDVQDFGAADVPIPRGLGVDAVAYLEGSTFGRLLNAEKRATEYALVESRRPNLTITFPKIDARHVGQFIALWEVATSYAGLMLNIDAYDQPAVETGKVATFGLMGRKGYEEWRQKVDRALAETGYRV
ncbi:MAG: glucose-6-phosphate isomerase [Phycisphaerales bacterium]|nr:glucose-6-phosphate isomerase [Phycisphaerales bacterium]